MRGIKKRQVLSVERIGDFVESKLSCGHSKLYLPPHDQTIDEYVQFCQQYVGRKIKCLECTHLFEMVAGLQPRVPALQDMDLEDIVVGLKSFTSRFQWREVMVQPPDIYLDGKKVTEVLIHHLKGE